MPPIANPKAATQPEILLITSLSTRRWILPKGWPMDGLTLAQSAAREAFEEAGIEGIVSPDAIGNYPYLKERKDGSGVPCSVDVFTLEVTGQRDDWPEKGARELLWLSLEQASLKVAEPGLRQLLADFGQQRGDSLRRTA